MDVEARAYRAVVTAIAAWGGVWFVTQYVAVKFRPVSSDPNAVFTLFLIAVLIGPGLVAAGYTATMLAPQPSFGAALATGVVIVLVSLIHCALLFTTSWRYGFHVFFAPQVVLAVPGTLLGGFLYKLRRVRGSRRESHGA